MIGFIYILVLILSISEIYTKEGYRSFECRTNPRKSKRTIQRDPQTNNKIRPKARPKPRALRSKYRIHTPMYYDLDSDEVVEYVARVSGERNHHKVQNRLDNYNGNLSTDPGNERSPRSGTIRLLEFHIRRFVRTRWEHTKVWTNPQKRKLERYKWTIRMMEAPLSTHFIFIGLFLILATIIAFMIHPSAFAYVLAIPILGEVVGTINGRYQSKDVIQASTYGDDIDAIQEAIDYARANGKAVVHVGGGTWSGGVADTLTFDGVTSDWNGIMFLGAGRYVTTLDFSALNGDHAVKYTHAGANLVSYPVIADMRVDGNANAWNGFDFDYTNVIYMENVYVTNFSQAGYAGFHFDNVFSGTMLNCRTWGCNFGTDLLTSNTLLLMSSQFISGAMGVWLNGCYSISLTDVSCEGNSDTGLYVRTGLNTIIRDCYFEENVAAQVRFTSTTGQRSVKCKIEHCYFQGGGAGAVSNYGILIDDSEDCLITDNRIWNHVTSGVYLVNTVDTEKCYDIRIDHNWYYNNPNNITVDDNAYRTTINEYSRYWPLITDNGHFTITPDRQVSSFKNNSGVDVCAGDTIIFDSSDDTGESFTTTTMVNDGLNIGVVYDGRVDTLQANANAGQPDIVVNDIFAWYGLEGETIRLRDDAGNTETKVIDSITTGTDTITVTVNLVNNYTIANNTYILLCFNDGDYCNIIEKGAVEYLHVDGTTDIAVADYLSSYSTAKVTYKGDGNFKAIALEAYVADNDNGMIKAQIINLKPGGWISVPFTQGFGGAGVADEGWLINAGGEYAKAWWTNPPDLDQIVSIKIQCVATNLEADGMLADFKFNAGAPNEPYNTHTVLFVSHVSTTTNYAANDVVDFDISDEVLSEATRGDKCSLEILYRAIAAPNEATDGQFASILVRYV